MPKNCLEIDLRLPQFEFSKIKMANENQTDKKLANKNKTDKKKISGFCKVAALQSKKIKKLGENWGGEPVARGSSGQQPLRCRAPWSWITGLKDVQLGKTSKIFFHEKPWT